MRSRTPSSNNRRLAPGARPRVPARVGANPHLATTLLVQSRAGGEQPCGETAPGLVGSVGPFICKRIQSTAAHRPRSLTLRAAAAPWSCQARAAPQRRGAQPQGLQQQRSHPGHSEQPAVPGPPPALPCLGAGGSAHSPQSPQAPAPHTAPGLHRVLGAGSAPTPQPPVAGPGTEPEGLPVPSENLSLLRPRVRGLSPGVLFIATASAGRGTTPQDPDPTELPAGGRAGRCPPPGTTPAMGRRGDGADVKLGAGSPPVPATGGCWAGEEASPLLPRDPAAGGWVGGGGAARP